MIDVEDTLRTELKTLISAPAASDWEAVLELAGHRRRGGWQRWPASVGVLAAVAAVLTAVAFATPLGGVIARGVGGFSAWISGEPGTPAPKAAQEAFARANARSWLGFPADTKLRQLATVDTEGKTVELLGFRAGDTLCLRVIVSNVTRSGTQACAPLAALRQAGAPVRVVLVDHGFGKGKKTAWYGLDRFSAPALQVTAGIAADGVRSVTLDDQSGSHTVPVQANAFLYVASSPDVGQRVDKISAQSTAGPIAVPFAPALFGFGGSGLSAGTLSGPTSVQRKVHGGAIGWLINHQPVGQPLTVLNHRFREMIQRHAVYGRVVAPDPGLPYRVAITLNTSPHGSKPIGVCTWQIGANGGGGGGCQRRADMFASAPITSGIGGGDGSSEYNTLTGLASDDVARITAYLSNGQTQPVALKDNAYFAELARNDFPVQLVAYDQQGRIIGLQTIRGFGGFPASPARGRPTLIKRVTTASGGYVELYTGPSTTGSTCTYIRWHQNKHAGGIEQGCAQPGTTGRPPGLLLEPMGNPAFVLTGHVPAGTTAIELGYADGTTTTTQPVSGYIVYAIPAAHLQTGHQLTRATAVGSGGATLATQSIPFRPRRK